MAGIGILLAAAVTALTVTGLRAALSGLAPTVRVIIPWQQLSAIAAVCLTIAVLASMIPAAVTLRKRPSDLAGAIE